MYNLNCKRCNKSVVSLRTNTKFCSIECRDEFYYQEKQRSFIGTEGVDYIICKWCGDKAKRIYGIHIKSRHLDKTIEDYRNEFPNSPITCDLDKHNTSINSGKHMQTEGYKQMFSEKFKGDNNPNHTSRTTKEYRQSISPYSIEFYHRKYPELSLSEKELLLKEFLKKQDKDKVRNTQLEYYTNKGYTIEDAKKMLSERQSTFTLEKCIKKHGEEKGREIWKKRQEQWLSNYKKNNFSKISQELFWEIYNLLENKNDVYFATLKNDSLDLSGKNNEYRLNLKNRVICPDFIDLKNKKIIEFDGTYWHSQAIKDRKTTISRDQEIVIDGFEILHIREDEFKNNKDSIILSCLKFLKNKKI